MLLHLILRYVIPQAASQVIWPALRLYGTLPYLGYNYEGYLN